MAHVHLDSRACENYYCNQVKGQYMTGGGSGPYFQSISNFQRGYGIFGDLRRFITPLALQAGRYLGKQFMQTGKNVITDIASGASFRDSTRNRIRETSSKIKKDIFEKLQQGKGIKRKKKQKKRQTTHTTTHDDIF